MLHTISTLLASALLPALPQQALSTPYGPAIFQHGPALIQPDCNGNGIPDDYEIAQGLTRDCNGDGIPDQCQLASGWVYYHDDGIAEGTQGWGAPYYSWMIQHQVEPGQSVITDIEIGRGSIAPGTWVTVGLWSDPDGDFDPTDAQPLVTVDIILSWPGVEPVVRIDIPDTFVGMAGTSFFVGVLGGFDISDEPLSIDFSIPSNKSWIISSNAPIDPVSPALGALGVSYINNADWVLRAISCPSGHCGELLDEDNDGRPDVCQRQDCNNNGIEDAQDIALGVSMDCQGDGIPDECQTNPGLVTYATDDGMDNAVGTNHDYQAWLTPHVVQSGGEVITDVEVAWGFMQAGTVVNVCLWSDPNGDGDPTDAQLILAHPTIPTLEGSGIFVLENIPDTFVGPAGTSFFLGASGHFDQTPPLPTVFPAAFDSSSPNFNAWYVSADAPIDLNNLSLGAAEFGRLNTVCACDGDWTIRAITCATGHCLESLDLNHNQVPDDCEPDCNGNLIPDDLDILNGLETDCNFDGIPDSCQALPDCDGNGLADLCQSVMTTGLAGEYFVSGNLSGLPLGQIDQQIDFDFSLTPPPAGIPLTDFSARWTGSVLTGSSSGEYRFSLLHEGPVRLWVNGVLLVDEWVEMGAGILDSENTILLSSGMQYQLRLESKDTNGDLLQLRWQQPGGLMLPLQSAETRPIYDRNFDGIPDVCQLVSDCNGNLVEDLDDLVSGTSLDNDSNQVPDECQSCEDKDGNGWLDSYEVGAGPGLVGQYFMLNPLTLEFSSRTRVVVDPQVSFDWALGSPVGVPSDRFGARWTGTLTTPAVSGNYIFEVRSDNGARLWIDEVLVIDNWAGSGTVSQAVSLNASSSHLVRLDYRETGGTASVELSWTVPGSAKVKVPSSALSPGTDLDGNGLPDQATSDCNLNGIPDGLDPDMDGNCVADACQNGTGYWRFEEASGPTFLDSTPNGLNGTLTTDPTRTTDVPVAIVPQTGAPNLQALDNGFVGAARVLDIGGLLSVPDNSFTLEAWVKMEILSSTSSANQRKWLFMKKPPSSPDSQLEYSLLVQAGDFGITGRELMFRYGDGSSVKGVLSSLSINDYDWHFVSVAYDADRLELRFGLDGVFETLPFDKPAISNVGTLMMGAHENSSGIVNQWLFGKYDEPRFSRTFLPPGSLLDHLP